MQDLFNGKTSEFQTNEKNFSAFVMPAGRSISFVYFFSLHKSFLFSGTAFFKFTPIQAEDIAYESGELKSSDSNLVFWFFVAFCFVVIGVGLTFIYMKKEGLGIKYELFAGYRNRLAFWR